MSVHTIRVFVMHRLIAVGLVVASLLLALGVPLAGRPAITHAASAVDLAGASGGGGCFSTTTPVCTFSQRDASAEFSSISTDGCIATDVFASAFESVTHPGNTSGQFFLVTISQFDMCNNLPLEAASNVDFTGTIQFGAGLSTVTVAGTATMVDKLSNATFTATVNLMWQGYGPTTRSIDSAHSHGAGLIVNTHFNGTSRAAQTSGTLSDGTTNFAATPSLFAELDNAKSGTVTINQP